MPSKIYAVFFWENIYSQKRILKAMEKGILVGVITGMWIYTLMNDTYDEFGSKTKEKDIWKLAIFTGVVNGFFYAVATGAFDS